MLSAALDAPAPVLDSGDIALAMGERILATPREDFPFPHFFAENVFPPLLYRRMLEHLPAETCFAPMEDRTNNPYAQQYRRLLRLNDGGAQLDPDSAPAWGAAAAAMLDRRFAKAVIAKFREPLAARYPSGKVNLRLRVDLMRDLEGFAIGPHSDAPHKVITGLLYMPRDESQLDLGTSIYLPKQAGFTENTGRHLDFEDFIEHKRFPFKPNSAFFFLKTEASFHGRAPIPPLAEPRYWINCSFQLAEHFLE